VGGPPHAGGTAGRRPRSPAYRRTAAVAVALAAMITTSMMAGPGHDALADEPCTLPRHSVHHSLGLDTWNDEYPRPDRDLHAVMLFLSFPDATPEVTPAEIAADYFPATTEFFLRASYGQFRLTAEITDEWVEMPQPSGAYGIQRDWEPPLRSAYLRDALQVLSPRTDFAGYDVIYLVADPDAPGVNSDATKVVNFDRPLDVDGGEIRRLVTLFESRPPDRNVLAHETGHVFDLPDLYRRPVDGSNDWDLHVGDWDVMGSQFGLAPEPFAWHKWKLGWLGPEYVACVRGETTSLHSIQPLGAPLDPAGPEGDTRLVVVRLGADEALALEARTPVGNDATACTEGVLLYRVRADVASAQGPIQVLDGHPGTGACHGRSVQPELANAPLNTGESHWLADENIRVEVGERTAAGGWDVKIVRE
jgi:M6 family metalloprotease-like protein